MIEVILTKGIPASGKSSWAKQKVSEDPLNWSIVNNDQIRAMLNNSTFSPEYEKLVSKIRSNIISSALKFSKNVIIDNVNADKRHFEQVCELVKNSNVDAKVYERCFYIDSREAIDRDSRREGKACVGKEIIEKFWCKLGKEQFKNYVPKEEVFYKRNIASENFVEPLIQDENLPRAVIYDNDGTIALIGNRSPYDASNCDIVDKPHKHVIESLRLHYNAGYKIIFVSGRQEKDRAPTERFYQKHFPDIKDYLLYMRPDNDFDSDVIIKENIYNTYIKDKYYIAGWYDDRLQIVKWLFSNGFPVFRVNDPESSF